MFEPSIQSQFSVEEVLNDKIVDGKLLYLVKWKGYQIKQSSWQPEQHLNNAPDQILLWKQKKKKLQRIDKVSTRKKVREESFDGPKYAKKNRTPKPLQNQKRVTPKRKTKNNLSQLQQNPADLSTSEDESQKSCNSETTSNRGKGLKKKEAKPKDPIESILQSIKKLKEKKSILAENKKENKVGVSGILPVKTQRKKPTKKVLQKNKQAQQEQKSIEYLKKIVTQKKLPREKQGEKGSKNLSIKNQKQTLEKVEKNKLTRKQKQSHQAKTISEQKPDKEIQKEMFSISKKEMMARLQKLGGKVQDCTEVPVQKSQIAQKNCVQRLIAQDTMNSQVKAVNRIPQKQLKQSLDLSFGQFDPNEQKRPVLTSFANVSRELMPKQADNSMLAKITKYTIQNERKKMQRKSKSRELFFNKSFDAKDYHVRTPRTRNDFQQQKVQYEQKCLDQLKSNVQRQQYQLQKSQEIVRPNIYDEVEKNGENKKNYRPQNFTREKIKDTSRDRSRDIHETKNKDKKVKKGKKDKKKKDKSKHKKKNHEGKHKKSRRRSESEQKEQRKRKNKRKHSSSSLSSSSEVSSQSISQQFSASSDIEQKGMGKSMKKQKQTDKSGIVEQRNKVDTIYQRGQQKQQRTWKRSVIDIAESSDNNSSSLAMIDEQQFTTGTSKRVALNEEYNCRYLTVNGDHSQKEVRTVGKERDSKRDEQQVNAETLKAVQQAKGLIDFLQQHPSKWWEKDMREEIRQIKKTVKEDFSKTINSKDSASDQQENWNFPFDENQEAIKPESVKEKSNPNISRQKITRSSSKASQSHQSQFKKTNKSGSRQSETDCFNLLVGDILDWFREEYPDDEATAQIRMQIEELVRQMVENDRGDDIVEKWMDDYGKRRSENTSKNESIKSAQKQLPYSEQIAKNNSKSKLDKSKGNIDKGTKSLDDITTFFKSKSKKSHQTIIKLQNDQIEQMKDKSPTSTKPSENHTVRAVQNGNLGNLVKAQHLQTQPQNMQPVKEDPRKSIYKDYPTHKQDHNKHQINQQQQNQQKPPQNTTSKPKLVVQSDNIIKIVSQFIYKGQKCYKILLNTGKEVNAHEIDVKSKCPKILLQFLQNKVQAFVKERNRNFDHSRGK